MVTEEQLTALISDMNSATLRSIASEEAYRVARATQYLALAIPSDGSKKPSEDVIKAKLDTDAGLIVLHHQMDLDTAEVNLRTYLVRAALSTCAKAK